MSIFPFSIQLIASAFNLASLVIGIPSFAVLLLYGIHKIHAYFSVAPTSTNFGNHPDALLTILKLMTETIGALGQLFGALGQFLFNVLALIAGLGLAVAIALWLTSKGLQANANWARVSAFILSVLVLLLTSLLALSLHNLPRLMMLLIAVICVFVMHGLLANPMPPPH